MPQIREHEKKLSLYQYFRIKYPQYVRAIKFSHLEKFLEDIFQEGFKAKFLPTDSNSESLNDFVSIR
jgi:hypothetical protein